MNIKRISCIVLIFAAISISCQARSLRISRRKGNDGRSMDEGVKRLLRQKLIKHTLFYLGQPLDLKHSGTGAESEHCLFDLLENYYRQNRDEEVEKSTNRPRPGKDMMYRPRPGRDVSEYSISQRRSNSKSFISLIEEWFQKFLKA